MRTSRVVFVFLFCVIAANAEIRHKYVDRTVDLTGSLTRVNYKLEIQNDGKEPASMYSFSLNDFHLFRYIEAKEGSTDLDVSDPALTEGVYSVDIRLPTPLASGKKYSFSVKLVLSGLMEAYPKKAGQSEPQSVLVRLSQAFYSKYATDKQLTTVLLPTDKIHLAEPKEVLKVDDKAVTLSKSSRVQPFNQETFVLHFIHPNPLVRVVTAERHLEVSHWANNLGVEEHFDVRHEGAELDKPFSRVDYQKAAFFAKGSYPVVQGFSFQVPRAAKDFSYRDAIGNISTSKFTYHLDHIELRIDHRYPLFGGWKKAWYHGYNLPLSSVLRRSGSKHSLRVPFISLFGNTTVDDFQLKIILPEGATNIDVKIPFKVDDIVLSRHHTYLDSFGRPVVTLIKKNVVPEHERLVEITYDFSSLFLLNEPLLLTIAFATIFALCMVLSRLDLSIKPDKQVDDKERMRGYVADVLTLESSRKGLYRRLAGALDLFKDTKNAEQFKSSQAQIHREFDRCQHEMQSITNRTRSLDPTLAAYFAELETLNAEKLACLKKIHSTILEVHTSKMDASSASSVINSSESQVKHLDQQIGKIMSSLND